MSHVELFELIEKLKAAGITHFKQGDLELSFSDQPRAIQRASGPSVPLDRQALGEPEEEPPHIVQELRSLMRLSDEELIERIFPVAPLDQEANA